MRAFKDQVMHNEQGILWLGQLLLVIPLALLVASIHFDLVRVQGVEGKMQNAADAGALAACLTAEAIPQTTTELQYDALGNLIGVIEKVTGFLVQIPDLLIAENQAKEAFERNTTWLSPSLGGFTAMDNFNMGSDWQGQPIGADAYQVDAKARVQTFFLGNMMEYYGLNEGNELTVHVTGKAKAHAEELP